MIVPQFWAEGRVQHKEPGRQVTVKRFGWSDTSEEEARSMAEARAQDALERILCGDKLLRREPKVSYNGAEGVPIREEILSRQGDTVITRNIYGAHCLNTPDVLFVDVDHPDGAPLRLRLIVGTCFLVPCIWHAISEGHLRTFFGGLIVSILGGFILSGLIFRAYVWLAGGPARLALRRVAKFATAHPNWHLRLYQTPAGYRLLVMHSTFDPDSSVVADCFKRLGADPVYVRMCQRQKCFRARVSPKPWRMGITQKIKPRPGVWPVNPERLPQRREWIDVYETKARGFASCRFIQTFGNGGTHPTAERVCQLHDELSRAHSGLPLA